MNPQILGIHHVTAIVEDAQQNVDFYRGVLGLRLVKQTVNYDDPYTYHFYYGNDAGRPGTIVTFFPWPEGRRGSRGTGEISALSFSVAAGALSQWAEHFDRLGLRHSDPSERLGERVLSLYDPAGLLLELVEQPQADALPLPSASPLPVTQAIRGLAGVTLTVADTTPTAALLTETLGFRATGSQGNRSRLVLDDGKATVDLIGRPDVPRGRIAAGSVHHVAWRVADDASQLAWRELLEQRGLNVTPVRDRTYFRSIYFGEPGGVIFEIATDGPGFAVDEAPEALGKQLQLPGWLEPQRANIVRHLPPVSVGSKW